MECVYVCVCLGGWVSGLVGFQLMGVALNGIYSPKSAWYTDTVCVCARSHVLSVGVLLLIIV